MVSPEHMELYSDKDMFRPSLYSLKDKKDLVGAEIGVAEGHNAEQILRNLDIKKLYLVDAYRWYGDYKHKAAKREGKAQKRLTKWQSKLKWMRMFSEEAAKHIKKGELDFVYIDANHEYPYVIKDLEYWYPKVKKGGIIAGHDYQLEGVRDAVKEYFINRFTWTAICRIQQRRKKQLVWIDWWIFKNKEVRRPKQ